MSPCFHPNMYSLQSRSPDLLHVPGPPTKKTPHPLFLSPSILSNSNPVYHHCTFSVPLVARKCPVPPPGPFSRVVTSGTSQSPAPNMSLYSFQHRVGYVCQDGFEKFSGSSYRVCEHKGEWSGEALACTGMGKKSWLPFLMFFLFPLPSILPPASFFVHVCFFLHFFVSFAFFSSFFFLSYSILFLTWE